MRSVTIAVLIAVFGIVAAILVEQVLTRVPQWVLRLAAWLCTVAAAVILLLSSPVFEQVLIHPGRTALITVAALLATAFLFLYLGFPFKHLEPRSAAISENVQKLRRFYDSLTLEERKTLRFILPLRRSPTNLNVGQINALESIQQKTGFVGRNYTTGSYELNPAIIQPLEILLSLEPPDAPTIDKTSDRLWVTLRWQNVRFENQYFERDEGYTFDATVTGGSSLTVKLRDLAPQVDAVVYAGAQAVKIQENKLVDAPKKWDANQSDRLIEIVDQKQRAVFQLVFDPPNHITVDGLFSPKDKPDRLTTRFNYPSAQHPSEYKLRE